MKKLLITASFLATAMGATAQTTVVNWGPSDAYVATNTDLVGYASGSNIDLSLTSPISPSLTSPGAGFNTTFYGGAEGFTTDTSIVVGLSTGRVGNNNPDRVQFHVDGTNVKNASLLLFRKDDFLGGGASNQVSLDGDSTFSYSMSSYFNGDNRLASFVVGVGDMTNPTFYRSGTFSFPNGSPSVVNVGFAGLSWFEYDPETEINIASSTSATPDFSNVSWLGLYGESTRASGNARVDIDHFGVDATTAIPEPSTFAALTGLLALGSVAFRRRSRG